MVYLPGVFGADAVYSRLVSARCGFAMGNEWPEPPLPPSTTGAPKP